MTHQRRQDRRACLRDLRQGGSGATPWRWRQLSMPGCCENWRDHAGSERLARDLYRGSYFVGICNAAGMPTNGQIYNTGNLCGDCAIACEQEYARAVSAIPAMHARRAGKTAAIFEAVTGDPLYGRGLADSLLPFQSVVDLAMSRLTGG